MAINHGTSLPVLEARPGSWGKQDLYLNGGILLRIYGAGDCDSIHWPFGENDRENLAAALYDEFEMGNIRHRTVVLPNGSEFDIDANIA